MPDLGCTDLGDLRSLLGDCRRCALGETRTRIVFGSGDESARVVIVGEAPGSNEDRTGAPFVGAAGRLLDELLDHAGIGRGDVYIANVIKCRPPNNRNPLPEEIETCTPFLREQIRLIDPEVLVTLGNFATRFVLKTDDSITGLRGTVRSLGRFKVLPVFHPAAAIYDRSKRDSLFADFGTLAGLLASDTSSRLAPDQEAPF